MKKTYINCDNCFEPNLPNKVCDCFALNKKQIRKLYRHIRAQQSYFENNANKNDTDYQIYNLGAANSYSEILRFWGKL